MLNSTPGPWHYEGHYILTDSEPQVVIAERVSEANRGLIASAPQLQAKIEALADALAEALKMLREVDTSLGPIEEADAPHLYAALRTAGRIP